MKLSVVIPARNEAGSIGGTIERLSERLDRESIAHEIVVVDDGSTDETAAVVQDIGSRRPPVRLVINTGLHGFGRAVVRGLDEAAGDAVVIVMADDSDDPDDVVRYWYVLRDRADCAFGSRFIAGGAARDYPWPKLVLNRMANTFIRWLFRLPYNDVTNAFKGYRASVVAGCRPFLSPHFNLTVELPLKAIARGYTYEVLPIGWRNRTEGRSSFHIREMGSRYMYIILVVWLERLLTRGDYRRQPDQPFTPWPSPAATADGNRVDAGAPPNGAVAPGRSATATSRPAPR
jgi:dolichol-phosphate mannosyltransferase